MTFDQLGQSESSQSALKTFAPELSALITIFRSVGQVAGYRCNRPVRLADGSRFRQEVRQSSGIDLGLAAFATRQQFDDVGAKLPREAVDELERRP